MNISTEKMGSWELQKAGYLLQTAGNLGMDVSGYGECSVNPNSGYTYLWLEDYQFTLYIPISCDLQESDVWVMWTNPDDGEEHEKTLDEFNGIDNIDTWCETLQKGEEE